MDPHAPDGQAADDDSRRDTGQDAGTVVPGEPAASVSEDADEDEILALGAESAIERVADVPWLSPTGGPALLYRAYFDSDPSAGALNLANLLYEECRPKGVTVEIKGVDEYTGIEELKDVRGIFCVFSSAPRSSWRTDSTAAFRQIVKDFRAQNPIRAVDGYYPESTRWQSVRTVQAFYADDDALEDPHCQWIIEDACAAHRYMRDVPPTGKIFEILKPGMAQLAKKNDRVAANNISHWRRLRLWGIESKDQAQVIRYEIEREVDLLENPGKRAMYRPIPGKAHNQLWLVLHDTDARPPANPHKTDKENHEDADKFVANSARAVRDLVNRLESTYEWFRQPEDMKRRGAQRHFARLYDILRTVSVHS